MMQDQHHPESHKFRVPGLSSGADLRSSQPKPEPARSHHPAPDPDDVIHEGVESQYLRHADSQQQLNSSGAQHPEAPLAFQQGATNTGGVPQGVAYSSSSASYPQSSTSSAPVSGLHLRTGASRVDPLKVEEPPSSRTEPKRILGLKVLAFWIVISVLVAILAIGLGVGLGLGLSRRSPTTTSSSVPTATNVQGLSSPAPVNPYCPSQNGSVITPYDASGTSIRFDTEVPMSFQVLCNTNFPAGFGTGNPGVRDILLMYTADLLTCMTLCAEYNTGYSDAVGNDVDVGGGICVGVSLIRAPAEFCYLKNATGINDTSSTAGYPADSAILMGDWNGKNQSELKMEFGGS